MTNKEIKSKVRKSKGWKLFRKVIFDRFNGKDSLTLKPLRKGWSVHHKDLHIENYHIFNPVNFEALNNKSHDCIHFLYTYYVKDHEILDRLKTILEDMEKLNEN